MKRGGLGRGLGALIPGAPEAGGAANGLLEIPVSSIVPNPRQPRNIFDDEALQSMAASVREVGVLQPVVVRRAAEGYELIAGERRFRAAQMAGLTSVPAVVRESDDLTSLQEALIENIHREDLNPIELAEAMTELQDEMGATQEELAVRVGMSRSHVANTLRLLQLPPKVLGMISEGRLQAGHGRALLTLDDADAREALALRVAAEDLSVRDVEGLVRRYQESPATVGDRAKPADRVVVEPSSPMAEVEEILAEQLATRVKIQMGARRGKIVIEFGSAEDLERIVSEIIGSGPGAMPS